MHRYLTGIGYGLQGSIHMHRYLTGIGYGLQGSIHMHGYLTVYGRTRDFTISRCDKHYMYSMYVSLVGSQYYPYFTLYTFHIFMYYTYNHDSCNLVYTYVNMLLTT